VVTGVVLAGCVGMQEESSAPHPRLGYIHLHSSFNAPLKRYRPQFGRITVESPLVKEKFRTQRRARRTMNVRAGRSDARKSTDSASDPSPAR
jgi:hypothetical protein